MKQFLNIFTAIICVFLSILLYVVVVGLVGVFLFRSFVSEDSIKTIIDEINVLELPATGFLTTDSEVDNETLKDLIVSKATDKGVSEVLVLQVLEDKRFNELLANFVTDYREYVINDDEKPKLSDESLEQLVVDSRDIVKETTGYVIPDSQVNQLNSIVQEFSLELNQAIPDKDKVVRNENIEQIITFVYSNWSVFIGICTIIGLLLLMMIFRFSVIAPLSWGGVVFIIAGTTLTIMAVLKTIIISLISDLNNFYSELFEAISSSLFKYIYFYGIGILLLGVGMLFAYKFFKKLAK